MSRLEVGTTVRFKGLVRGFRGNNLLLGFQITGADGRGLSIYRDGKRVRVTYRVRSKKGKVLAEGAMNYG